MKKKLLILPVIISVFFIFCTIYVYAAEIVESGNCGNNDDNVIYSIDNEGTLIISGTGDMKDYEWIAFHGTNSPWYQNTEIKSIVIQDGVTSIGSYAFYGCSNLTEISIAESVKSVGENAFYNCGYYNNDSNWINGVLYIDNILIKVSQDIENCNIKNNTKIIANYAFQYCKISDIALPDDLMYIGKSAFSNSSLTNISLPNSVVSIGNNAFSSCQNLQSITIPSQVTNIGSGTFYGCYSLTDIILHENIETIDTNAFGYCTALTNINISEGTQFIASEAFIGCQNLTDISLPNSLTNIGEDVFKNTSYYNDSSNWIDGVLYLENYIVSTKENIEMCNINPTTTLIADGAFKKCYFADITIPDSVIYIGKNVFSECKNVKTVTLGRGIKAVNAGAFWDDINIESIYISDMGAYLNINFYDSGSKNYYNYGYTEHYSPNPMYYANKLYLNNELVTSVVIPDTANQIAHFAFCGCEDIINVTIPDSVTRIGKNAFENCTNLTSVALGNGIESVGICAFENDENIEGVYISDMSSYLNIDFESAFYPQNPNRMTYLSNPVANSHKLYLNNKLVTSVVVPDTVTKIASSAFYGCIDLTNVTIPDTVTDIGSFAFHNCDGIDSITIPDSVNTIGDMAFYGCDNITEVTIGDSVKSMGYGAFKGCFNISKVHIKDIGKWNKIDFMPGQSTTYYSNPLQHGADLYLNNELVTDLVIPDGVTEISSYAFQSCGSILSVTIPDSVISIGSGAFMGCEHLKSVTLGNGLETVGSIAFNECYNIESVYISDLVNYLNTKFETSKYGSGILYTSNPMYYANTLYLNNTPVTGFVEIPDGVQNIARYAFYGCNEITSVTIPDSVIYIGAYAFSNCNKLTTINYDAKNCSSMGEIEHISGIGDIFRPAFDNSIITANISKNVESLPNEILNNWTSLSTIEYEGSEEQWNDITNSDRLSSISINYNVPIGYIELNKPNVLTENNISTRTFKVTPNIAYSNSYIYIAIYDENGVLLDIKREILKLTGETDIEAEYFDNESYAKVFIWYYNARPLALTETVALTD